MYCLVAFAFVAFAAVDAFAASIPKRLVLHERSVPSTNTKWRRGAKVASDSIVPLRIGITQTNLESGEKHLMNVADPLSDRYGKHWTAAEVSSFFAPAAQALEDVKQWLAEHGIYDDEIMEYENKGWLAADVPASKVEELFQTSLYEHEHQTSGDIRIGCSEYHVPEHLKHHIDYITPGVKFSPNLKKRSITVKRDNDNWGPPWHHHWGPKPGPPHWGPPGAPWQPPPGHHGLPPNLKHCGTNMTPPCIRALYDIPLAHLSDDVNAVGLFEDGDYWDQQDLNLFFAKYAPHIPQGTAPTVDSIDGGVPFHQTCAANGTGCGESVIDVDIVLSLVWPQEVIVYQVDDIPHSTAELAGKIEGFLNNFLDALDGSYCNYTAYGITGNSPGIDAKYPDPKKGGYKGKLMCGAYKPTRVISTSYGEGEADLPINYQKRQCSEFLKLGLQGHTFLFSSGDFGVAAFDGDVGSPNGCLSGFGQNGTIFTPEYPVNCPYVTAVGATQLNSNDTVYDAESAMEVHLKGIPLVSSSGGFSNYFPAPSYQNAALAQYFAVNDPGYPYYIANEKGTNIGVNGGRYNRAGRGFPDISANGANLMLYVNGTLGPWYGTSLTAPTWASVITLINQERTAVGKGPVGFINPVLYQNAHVLTDITNGSNPGCHSQGFKAVAGWDPITGLGTPKYPKLLELFMSLP